MNWPLVDFSAMATDASGGNVKTLQSDFLPYGTYPIVDQGQSFIAGYTDSPSRLCKARGPVVVFGDHTKCFKFIDFPFCMGADGTKVLVAKEGVDAKYLYYALQTVYIPEAGYSRHFKYLKESKLPFPPLPEQRRIAAILDQADALRRLRHQAVSRLTDLSAAKFYEMFGDPNHLRSLTNTKKIGDFCRISSGSTPRRDATGYYDGDIPWVKTTEVKGGTILSTEERITDAGQRAARLKLYPAKTILVAMYGQGKTRGSTAILGIKSTINQACAAIQCDNDCIPEFLFYQLLLSYDRLRAMGQGGNQPNLNAQIVREFEVLVPSLTEQQDFLRTMRQLDELRAFGEREAAQLESLFTSLKHRAFGGEL